MSAGNKRLVYGPAPSRRLGRSLGLDLVPFKHCSYDCIYCQIGRTTHLTVDRADFAPVDEVIRQLGEALAQGADPDVITLGGSGEPTLHSGLGEVIRRIKTATKIPVAVLTNGSLLFRPDAREELRAADIVVPDLDAGSAEIFSNICRPHPSLDFERVAAGLEAFGREFTGRLLLEVFLVEGENDSDLEVDRIAARAARVPLARVQLNTVTRPAAETSARGVCAKRMSELAGRFDPAAQVIADFQPIPKEAPGTTVGVDEVADMLERRPCTIEDLAHGLRLPRERVAALITRLLAESGVVATVQGARTYYHRPPDREK